MPQKKEEPITARGIDLSKEDEMLPEGAKQVTPPSTEGNEPDTAGTHGPMAPEAARGLEAGRRRKDERESAE